MNELESRFPDTPYPVASLGGELVLQLSWKSVSAYIDIDIGEDNQLDWFALIRKSGCSYGTDNEVIHELPEEFYNLFEEYLIKDST